ncbi:hypothetical protein C7212DRAFT_306531 [Tuber magnatum]|uniref:Uncharacterized protein n=1 Tax=Tuber magnatum TaxID=42249 RepID=A0A317T5G8_9PEZI|nr:hypothetical protein C7212DRAFT_306531 [Tuber magnatum]
MILTKNMCGQAIDTGGDRRFMATLLLTLSLMQGVCTWPSPIVVLDLLFPAALL